MVTVVISHSGHKKINHGRRTQTNQGGTAELLPPEHHERTHCSVAKRSILGTLRYVNLLLCFDGCAQPSIATAAHATT